MVLSDALHVSKGVHTLLIQRKKEQSQTKIRLDRKYIYIRSTSPFAGIG